MFVQHSSHPARALLLGLAATLFAGAALANNDSLLKSTADHSKFKELQQEFKSGPEVTKVCLQCHTEASRQIHKTQHWNWEYRSPEDQKLGKRHVVNNFCMSVQSNQKACASCHIGYGLTDESFDFSSETNVDCLVCHDTTGKYKKPGGFAGHPVTKDTEFPPGSGKIIRGINLSEIAQKVAKSSRNSCGACHFYGGGGDGVKHGDMDSTLEAPGKSLDVHMDADGLNFTCATCHKTEGHQVPGSRYSVTAQDKDGAHIRGKADDSNPGTCQACHGQTPHKTIAKLNDHTDRIACQTCHIPKFARGDVPTKMAWDWSTAGKRGADGKPLMVRNDDGHVTYNGTKGDFVLADNVVPEYLWFNGKNRYLLPGDTVEKGAEPIYINRFEGSASDGKSMIWPVKVFRGKQPYDSELKSLVVTHVAGEDENAFWKNLDWTKGIAAGQKVVGRPFSGKHDFVETISMWPITHMVAPKEDALGCADCHGRNGRLAKVDGIYIPGRDAHPLVDRLGWLAVFGALVGVTLHGLVRIASRKH